MISVFVKIHRGKTGVFLNDGSLLFDRNGQEYNPQTSRQTKKMHPRIFRGCIVENMKEAATECRKKAVTLPEILPAAESE